MCACVVEREREKGGRVVGIQRRKRENKIKIFDFSDFIVGLHYLHSIPKYFIIFHISTHTNCLALNHSPLYTHSKFAVTFHFCIKEKYSYSIVASFITFNGYLCHGPSVEQRTATHQRQTKRTHETCRVKQTDNQNNQSRI